MREDGSDLYVRCRCASNAHLLVLAGAGQRNPDEVYKYHTGPMAAGVIISGNIKGIAAAESANSSVVGANLIPLLTLGIL